MNAKHSLSTISSAVALLCFAGAVSAQTPYERVLEKNLWNDGIAVNGIRQQREDAAEAQLFAGIGQGGLKAPWEASGLWKAGAWTRAVRHLERFTMSGAFGFEQMQGDAMCGPMSIEPGYFPIEVWEFTPGKKTLQSYSVDGAISVDITGNLRLGGRFGMDSENYSKRKDLRHTNYRLDIGCAAGLMWHSGEFAVELDGIAGKCAETINAEQIGTATASYFAFLDKGQMYGTYELWTGSGVHLHESGVSGLPLKESIYGAALEAGYGDKLFAGVQYRHKEGSAGEKEYIWFRFPADLVDMLLGGRFGSSTFRLSIQASSQDNSETVLDKTSSGGVTTVKGYGSNLILQKRRFRVAPSYEHNGKSFIFKAEADYSHEKSIASQMLPYTTGQRISTLGGQLSGRYLGEAFEVELSLGAGKGWISEWEDRVMDIQTGDAPQRYEEGYGAVAEYICAAKADAGLEARWYPGWNRMYIGLDARCSHSLEEVRLLDGRSRIWGALSVGIDF